ncbi:auxin efflux carrier [Flagelloscypha sp. PMI_526]|nr:auxin efflux carrier [Flagelloscypha sp. PMI_526]
MTGTPFWTLLTTVCNSILQVFLTCLAGFILAHSGILDKRTQRQLNKLNVSLFTPALLFSKVAFFLTPSKLKELWVIPIFFVVVTAISMGTAQVLGWALRLKRSQRAFATAAAMFMNSNSLPIALMQALVVTVPHLKWGKDDNKDAMLGRSLTYLVMYSTLGMVLRWSYGVRLLAQADDEPTIPDARTQTLVDPEQATERTPLLASSTAAPTVDITPSSPFDEAPAPNLLRPLPKRKTTFYNSFPNTPNASRISINVTPALTHEPDGLPRTPSSGSLDSDYSSEDVHPVHHLPYESTTTFVADSDASRPHSPSESLESPPESPVKKRTTALRRRSTGPAPAPPVSFLRRTGQWTKKVARSVHSFMTAPLYAALLSLVVALIPPLQHFIMVHAWPVKGALESVGSVSIPMTLVVLGAYFYVPPVEGETQLSLAEKFKYTVSGAWWREWRERRSTSPASRAADETKGETKTVVIAIAARMFLTPLLILPFMVLSTLFDVQRVFSDPVFVVANTLLISSPPALTLAQITQAANGDAFERLVSKTIFWAYCVVTPPTMVAWVVVGLFLGQL